MAVFVICTGGLVYSLINQMPWFKFERDEFGNIVIGEVFMRGQRGQWKAEGYIVSVLCSFIGLAYLYLSRVAKNHNKKSEMRYIVLGLLVLLYVSQMALVFCYRTKSEWYNPSFMPPGYYQKGSFLQDQGNIIANPNNINY